ncbi:hypothetical protein ACIRVF_36800 [Kitasatospora sp. NPDC101157]
MRKYHGFRTEHERQGRGTAEDPRGPALVLSATARQSFLTAVGTDEFDAR